MRRPQRETLVWNARWISLSKYIRDEFMGKFSWEENDMKKITKTIFAALVAAFVFGTFVSPTITPVFAAEQTADQQQNPPADAPQGGNEHSGHHG